MTELDDHDLLAEFARSESESAFAALAARHVNLVHSAALRFTGNAHSAQEITQAVFVILARKAGSISRNTILSGWLYQTARLTAANFVKAETRRQQREQEAYMQSTLNEPADTAAWQQIAPLLDAAMGDLGETDRNAVVLRFFENKTAQEVGAALKLTEAAAHKRTARALEKLRKFFTKRGLALSAVAIAGAVSANSVQAAPASLAATVTAAAAKGAGISATLTTLVKGTMKTMTWLKIKFAVAVGVAALLAGGAATVSVSQTTGGGKLTAAEILTKSRDTYAALTSYSDDGKTVAGGSGTTITTTFSIKLGRPNLYRVEWERIIESKGFKSDADKQFVWSEGKGNFLEMFGKAQMQSSLSSALSSAAGISRGASATIPGTFFNGVFSSGPNLAGGAIAGLKQQADAKVSGVDCYAFADELKGRKRTIWIGKQDFLIHQTRTVTSAAAVKAGMDMAAKQHPEIAARMAKMEYADSTSTETHEHIVVNQKFSASDFAR
jgi:RNA polymerase sigma factor (sigma-70 family)